MSTGSGASDLQQVQVLDIDDDGTYATVLTRLHTRLKVSLRLRNGKGAWPRVGEIWFISRMYGRNWVFAACVDPVGKPPEINVDREGADDLALKLLDALVNLGLVTEADAATSYSGNDFAVTDPAPLITSTSQGDDPVAPADADAAEVIPASLWLGTFNPDGATRGNAAILTDLKRLLKTPVKVLGLQEMSNGDRPAGFRDPLATWLASQGWAVLRKEGSNSECWNWLCYDPRALTLVEHDWSLLVDASGGRVARWALWARFVHSGSGQRLVFVTTHLAPPSRSVSDYQASVAALGALVTDQSSWGPVYVAGDMNVDYRATATYTGAGYPGAVLDAHGTVANWATLGAPADLGTHGKPLIDYLYQGPDTGGLGAFVEQRVLRGYRSSHRPVLVRVQMKRKDTDIPG